MVVGNSRTALDPHTRGFLYHNGTMRALGTLGGDYSTANGINSAGQVAGTAGVPVGPGNEYGDGHAYRYTNGTMVGLGTLGGSWSVGLAINERGDVAGYSKTASGPSAPVPPGSPTEHACVWRGEGIVDLGTLGGAYSRGLAINAAGDVVGESQDRYGRTVAFLYTNGSMHDLNELAVTWAGGVIVGLAIAQGINDAGQIAASGCTGTPPWSCKAYRLDPVLTAVEYHHADFDHYFVTTSPDEIFLWDSNARSGWKRTGMTFAAFPLDLPHVAPMCRFSSGQTFAPRSSHFYTSWRDECDRVRTNPDWQFEGEVFGVWLPADWGGCEPGTERLFRLYNGGRSGAPNHRYTTNMITRMSMVQQGWVPEGIGELGVIGCVPKI
jgi:probable HAF family extracellular repeat protein